MKNKIISCIIILVLSNIAIAYDRFPLPENQGKYKISDSLGSSRGTNNNRLHNGVDINNTNPDLEINMPVVAIKSGIFKVAEQGKDEETVRIIDFSKYPNVEQKKSLCPDFYYTHIDSKVINPSTDKYFENGDYVSAGTQIGKLKLLDPVKYGVGNRHLHLTERSDIRVYNPMEPGRMFPNGYDNCPPVILHDGIQPDGNPNPEMPIRFYKNNPNLANTVPSETPLKTNDLKDQVDILVPTYDLTPNNTYDAVAPYELEYRIYKGTVADENLKDSKIAFTFTDIPGDPNTDGWQSGSISKAAVTPRRSLYWATNDAFRLNYADSYWNTKQFNGDFSVLSKRKNIETGEIEEKNELSNAINATSNFTAKFPDGKYIVRVIVRDAQKNESHVDVETVVNNFPAYVSKVAIKQDAEIKYSYYKAPDNSTEIISKSIKKGVAELTLRFSEEMSNQYTPVVKLDDTKIQFDTSRTIIKTTIFPNDTWVGYFNVENSVPVADVAKSYRISVEAKDLSDKPIQDEEKYIWIGVKEPIIIVKLTPNMLTQSDEPQTHFSPAQPIFTIEFPGQTLGKYKVEAAFKNGNATSIAYDSIYNWDIDYDLAQGEITGTGSNIDMVDLITDATGKDLLQFQWNGLGRDGLHVYDEDIVVDVKVTDEAGNVATDNSQHFKITPDGIVYDPNDPDRSREKMIAKFRNNANKTFILGSPLSVGGMEFSNLKKLFGGIGLKNVGFRSWNIFGDKKWGGVDEQVDSIKRQVEAFSANPADKVTMVAWGQAGVLAKEYIRKYLPTDKIAKLITVGTPLKGINSIPMAIQSQALTCLLTPVVTFIDSLGLNDMFTAIQERAGPYGPDLGFLSFLQQVGRNDLVMNPLNVIGLLLGRQDYAKYFQHDSDLMKDLNQFNTTDIGIDHSSVTTALWPNMDDGVQLGIVGIFTGLGMAGAYTSMELFSLQSKTYNNINDEVANILVDLVLEEINRIAFNPIRNAINEAERNAIKQSFLPIWQAWLTDFRKSFPNASPQDVINAFVQAKVLGPIEQGTNVILGPIDQVQQYIEDPNGPIAKLRGFVQTPLVGDVGNTLRKVIGDKATTEVNNLLSSVISTALPVAAMVDPQTGLAAEIKAGVDDFKAQLTNAITKDVNNLTLEVDGQAIDNVNLNKEAEKLCTQMDQYFNLPFEIINKVIEDFLLEKIQVPLRKEMKKQISTLLPDFNKILGVIPPLRVAIPGGAVGGAIVGAMAYLATDYLKNTDGISEAHPLALSKLMGLSAGQAADGGQNVDVTGWHWSGASASNEIAQMITQSAPQICGISLRGIIGRAIVGMGRK